MRNHIFHSLKDILLFAIDQEAEAGIYYEQKARETIKIELKQVWQQLAHDELRHKTILTELLEKMDELHLTASVKEIHKYTPENLPEREYSEIELAIIDGINNENEAYFMYKNMAETVTNESYKAILLRLALEELKHKESLLVELAS